MWQRTERWYSRCRAAVSETDLNSFICILHTPPGLFQLQIINVDERVRLVWTWEVMKLNPVTEWHAIHWRWHIIQGFVTTRWSWAEKLADSGRAHIQVVCRTPGPCNAIPQQPCSDKHIPQRAAFHGAFTLFSGASVCLFLVVVLKMLVLVVEKGKKKKCLLPWC